MKHTVTYYGFHGARSVTVIVGPRVEAYQPYSEKPEPAYAITDSQAARVQRALFGSADQAALESNAGDPVSCIVWMHRGQCYITAATEVDGPYSPRQSRTPDGRRAY